MIIYICLSMQELSQAVCLWRLSTFSLCFILPVHRWLNETLFHQQTSFQFGEQFAFPHIYTIYIYTIYIYTIYIYNVYIYICCKPNRVYIRIIYTYIQGYIWLYMFILVIGWLNDLLRMFQTLPTIFQSNPRRGWSPSEGAENLCR